MDSWVVSSYYYYKHAYRDTVVHVSQWTYGRFLVSFGISLTGFGVYTLSVLQWMTNCFPKRLYQPLLLPVVHETSLCFTSPPSPFLIGLFNVCQYGGYQMDIILVLIYMSLITMSLMTVHTFIVYHISTLEKWAIQPFYIFFYCFFLIDL